MKLQSILRKINYIKENYLIESIILIVIGVILINTLFISPIVGKHDNGDFDRLMRYGGLTSIGKSYKQMYDGYFHSKFLISNPGEFMPFYIDWVSGAILLKIAVAIFAIAHLFTTNVFDIRYLSFVYCVVFMIAIFLILSYKSFSPLIKVAAGIYITLFFTDVCYITYFNSFW